MPDISLRRVLAALLALSGAGASLRVRDDVVQYDLFSNSWLLRLQLDATSHRWDVVVPFACAHANCSAVPFFEGVNPYMQCDTIGGSVFGARTSWHHARPEAGVCQHDLAACTSAPGDWVYMQPPLSLRVRADVELLRQYSQLGVTTVRVLFVRHLDESNSTCLAETADVSFELPQHMTPLASLVARNPCTAAGMLGPEHSLLVRVEVPGELVCVWKCHSMYMRRPWNAAPVNVSLSCDAFPHEFTAVFVSVQLEVPRWWRVSELGQDFFDAIDETALLLEENLAAAFAGATVACVVQGSIYDFMSLAENVQQYVAYEQRAGFSYETIENQESMLRSLRSETADGSLRLNCRMLTSEVLLQPENIKQSISVVFGAVLQREAVVHRLQVTAVVMHDIEQIVWYCQTRITSHSAVHVRVYQSSMVLVEGLCLFAMLFIVGSRAIPDLWSDANSLPRVLGAPRRN